jgi:pSer/pThr/pTyr-binding forkhead associated (FHA) protein
VGRATDNDLCLHAPGVSRYHAVLRQTYGRIAVEDLGSTNGTFVNGTRIVGQVMLHDGDRIRFGGEKEGISVVVRQPQQAASVS